MRTLSAIAMLAVAGGALWLGGYGWALFVGLVAAGVLWEWRALVRGFVRTRGGLVIWNLVGFLYIGTGAAALVLLRDYSEDLVPVLAIAGAVIATDIGAYFAGRAFGGPKIAPSISPSKTWAGLAGGMAGAALVLALIARDSGVWPAAVLLGCVLAIVAQAGDFFESWMKRRAGVKDSGRLLPGHGGLFDRVDGLLAVLFLCGLFAAGLIATALLTGQSLLPSPA